MSSGGAAMDHENAPKRILMTEPHDGHEPAATCPGCPHDVPTMHVTGTLSDFLLARFAEDEQTALQIGESSTWREDRGDVFAVAGLRWRRVAEIDEANGVSTVAGEHIARHDPARVLAECEAKRRIVEELVRAKEALAAVLTYPASAERDASAALMRGIVAQLEGVVALLALPHASHPDYDERWRPRCEPPPTTRRSDCRGTAGSASAPSGASLPTSQEGARREPCA